MYLLTTRRNSSSDRCPHEQARQNLERVIEKSADRQTGYGELLRAEVLSGDVVAARQTLKELGTPIATAATRVPCFWSAIACREFAAALEIANSMRPLENSQFAFECGPAARGWALHFQGNERGARAEFERARPLLESYIREHPDEANGRSELAIVLAQLGQADEALRQGRIALGLYPALQDAWIRQFRVFDLAVVEMLTGQHDAAIERFADSCPSLEPDSVASCAPAFDRCGRTDSRRLLHELIQRIRRTPRWDGADESGRAASNQESLRCRSKATTRAKNGQPSRPLLRSRRCSSPWRT
jgi:tetratricopeptide (TPR) repeat protein